MCVLSMVAFVPQWLSLVVVTRDPRAAKLNMFATWSATKFAEPWFTILNREIWKGLRRR